MFRLTRLPSCRTYVSWQRMRACHKKNNGIDDSGDVIDKVRRIWLGWPITSCPYSEKYLLCCIREERRQRTQNMKRVMVTSGVVAI